ncbi:MAG: hypothetical protein AB9835_09705 [Eubacteriales bacterium]
MIKRTGIILAFIMVILISGCGVSDKQSGGDGTLPASVLTSETMSGRTIEVTDTASQAESTTSEVEEDGGVTPYQFLNLLVGNAEEITFSYTVKRHETDTEEKGEYYKSGDKSVEVFTAQDMDGQSATVRMLEYDGFVHYIMDGSRRIKTYPSSQESFLLNRMMKVAMSDPAEVVSEDGVTRYSYVLPFEQDEAIVFQYVLFMKDDALIKMTCSVDGMLSATYELSAFEQREGDASLFLLPDGYEQENFDYPPEGGQIPPWWENDGLQ